MIALYSIHYAPWLTGLSISSGVLCGSPVSCGTYRTTATKAIADFLPLSFLPLPSGDNECSQADIIYKCKYNAEKSSFLLSSHWIMTTLRLCSQKQNYECEFHALFGQEIAAILSFYMLPRREKEEKRRAQVIFNLSPG